MAWLIQQHLYSQQDKNDRVRKKQGLGKGCHPSELRQDFMLCSNDPEYMMKKVEYCYNHGLMEIRQ